MGTSHFDGEDGLLYVTMEIYFGKSTVGPVILVSRAPIMKNVLCLSQYDETPVHVADVIRMTGAVLEKRRQESCGGDSILIIDPTTGSDPPQ